VLDSKVGYVGDFLPRGYAMLWVQLTPVLRGQWPCNRGNFEIKISDHIVKIPSVTVTST
jgi:hypothetical protein